MPHFDHDISSSPLDNETSGGLLLIVRYPLSRGMRHLLPHRIRTGKHLCMRSFPGFDLPFSSSRPRSRAAPYRWKGSYKQQQHRCGKQRKLTFMQRPILQGFIESSTKSEFALPHSSSFLLFLLIFELNDKIPEHKNNTHIIIFS